MRRVRVGEREVDIHGSPMTPLYYKREFRQSLSGDLLTMQTALATGRTWDFDDVNLLQMLWALEKTAKNGQLTDFETWMSELDWLDVSELTTPVTEEVMNATFRDPPKVETKKKTEPKR